MSSELRLICARPGKETPVELVLGTPKGLIRTVGLKTSEALQLIRELAIYLKNDMPV